MLVAEGRADLAFGAHRFSTSSSYYNFGDEIEEQKDI